MENPLTPVQVRRLIRLLTLVHMNGQRRQTLGSDMDRMAWWATHPTKEVPEELLRSPEQRQLVSLIKELAKGGAGA